MVDGPHIGWYLPGPLRPSTDRGGLIRALHSLEQDLGIVEFNGQIAWASGGAAILTGPAPKPAGTDAHRLLAHVPALRPSQLGDPAFSEAYGLSAPYVAGAMANGIGSVDMVVAMSRVGLLGFFGSAGLGASAISAAIDEIQRQVGQGPYGFNLIHSPNEPTAEQQTVDLYLAKKVPVISASAYMKLTAPLVQFRCAGLEASSDGRVLRKTRIIAKVSRPEVAEHFLRPAPDKLLNALVLSGKITESQAALARRVPVADDITAEADSGGHTDGRPLTVLLPVLQTLRDRLATEYNYRGVMGETVRIGAAGGLGSPEAVAAAFSLGAAYVLTGTVNQACVESGTSSMVKTMLAQANFADVGMAPAGDMFEQGAEVQVLTRGTMFARRGSKLRSIYLSYDSLEAIPTDVLGELESRILRRPVAEIWAECEQFFAERDPEQLARAASDPRHKMALVFRWYLGLSSRWAIRGDSDRRADVQIWCGPAIGSFNAWTKGTFLEAPENRYVDAVAINLLSGAAALMRSRSILQQGVDPGEEAWSYPPRPVTPDLRS